MNKKLIYTGIWLCLGGLALGQNVWAKSDNANKQSMKKCPESVIKSANVVLTKQLTFFGDTDANLEDDVHAYQLCDADKNNCQDIVLPQGYEEGITGLTIIGSNKSDTIYGTSGPDTICGMNGKDVIYGLEGNDTIHGNNSSDHLVGGPGDDFVYGGNSNDFLFGYDDDDIEDPAEVEDEAGGGDFNQDDVVDALDTDIDHLEGGNGKDELNGGPNGDDLSGGNGKDTLRGDDGDDTLDGGTGSDDVDGGDGDDTKIKGKGKDTCTDDDDLEGDDCAEVESENEHGNPHN